MSGFPNSGGGGGGGSITLIQAADGSVSVSGGSGPTASVSATGAVTLAEAGVLANNLLGIGNAGATRANINDPVLAPCAVVSTANIAALSGLPVVDQYQLAATDEVLLVAQTTPSQNGPWKVAAGAWTRPTDFATGYVVTQGRFTVVKGGFANANSLWILDTPTGGLTVDTSAQPWAPMGQAPASALSLNSNYT